MGNKIYNILKGQVRILSIAAMVIGYGFQVTGQTLVGALPGSIDVSPTGAATYAVPIEVVPGTQGMQPNLSIVYNSQSGNGALGMKWDLAGLSAITRIPKTPYFDNDITAIKWDTTDRYALDGSRLIVTNNLRYGTNGAEYGTEMVNFAKIKSVGSLGTGPAYFEVITDDGTVIEYGNNTNARMELNGTAAIWMINKITDIHGNYMTFSYIKDNNLPWIDKIEYTGGMSLTPYAKVSFTYKTNTATTNVELFMGGYSYRKTKLLEKITISYENTAVREYLFTYTQNNRYNRLSQIELNVNGTTVLNPTLITWGNTGEAKTLTDMKIPDGEIIVGDFNGDGILDILRYNIGSGNNSRNYEVYFGDKYGYYNKTITGSTAYIYLKKAYVADINGDGIDEFIYIDILNNLKYCKFVNKTASCSTIFSSTSQPINSLLLGDFNGDGTIDIAYDVFLTKTSKYKQIYIRTNINNSSVEMSLLNSEDIWYTCDFNGDGRTDIAVTNSNGMIIYGYNNTMGKINKILYQGGYPTRWHRCYFGDFNGDGIQDILTYSWYQSQDWWEIHLGTGTGYAWSGIRIAPPLSTPMAPDKTTHAYAPFIADFDGDGKDDIIQIVNDNNKAKIHVYFTRNITQSNYTYDYSLIEQNNWQQRSDLFYTIGDVNNDGKVDLIYRTQKCISFYAKGEEAFVKKITNGMDVETELDYSKSVWRKLSSPMVLELRQSDGLGSLRNITQFTYSGLEFSYSRRSFLGFTGFKTKNINDVFATFYNFRMDNSYQMLILDDITKYTGSNPTQGQVSQRVLTTNFLSFGNKRILMYNSKVVDKDELDKRYYYTERVLCKGTYKGRDSIVISGVKLIANPTADYELKSTQEITYTDYTISANNKLIRPKSIISKEQTKGFSLEKMNTVDYTYIGIRLTKVKTTNAHGYRQTEYSNFSYGIPLCIIETANGTTNTIRTDYTYDAKRRFVTQEKSQNANIVYYTYDNKTGNLLRIKDINTLKTDYNYDDLGRKIKTSYPDGTDEIIKYCWKQNWNSSTTAPANTSFVIASLKTGMTYEELFYDKLGRELKKRDLNNLMVETRYNNFGLVEKVSYPYDQSIVNIAWQFYAYDEYGRIIYETGPITNICYLYNTPCPLNVSKIVTAKDNLRGTTYTKTYDAASRLISSTDLNGTINYSYSLQKDNKNNVCDQTQISAFGNTTTILTDQWGNRLKLTDPDAGEITATYNGFGQVLSQTDANGVVSSFTYDNFGRTTRIRMNSNGQTNTIDYAYDANNKKGTLSSETMQPDNTRISYTYDNLMRLTGKRYKENNNELTYSYSYNTDGQLEKIVYPSGFSIQYEYLNGNMIKRIWDVTPGSYANMIFYINGGIRLGMPENTTTYRTQKEIKRNNIGQLESKTANIILGGGTCQDFSYTYDNVGRMIMRGRDPVFMTQYNMWDYQNKEHFSYDKSDRLTDASWQYLIPSKPHTPGQPVHWSSHQKNLFTMTYDQNLITSNSAVGDYTYNHSSKPHALMEVEPYDENTISQNKCELTYTAFNKVKTIDEGNYHYDIRYYPNKNQAVTTLMDGNTIISQKQYAGKAYEIDYATDTKYHYVYAYGEPVAVIIQQGNGAFVPYSILTDHLGSIDLIVDKNGNIVDSMSFDAWGNRRDRYDWALGEDPNVVHLIDRGFTGHQHLDVFNLINMGGRVYDPVVQQFLSPDPYVPNMTNTQDLNRYTYARCSPLMYTDPDGEWVQYVVGAIMGGISGWQIGKAQGAKGWEMAGYIFGGAIIGTATAGIGTAVSSAVSTSLTTVGIGGFAGGVISGSAGGLAAGTIGGFQMGVLAGNAGNDLWKSTWQGGLIGMGTGGLIGGITEGINSVKHKANFWSGLRELNLFEAEAHGGNVEKIKNLMEQGIDKIKTLYVGTFEGVNVYESKLLGVWNSADGWSGVTLPQKGIYVGRGVYSNDIDMMMHEFGHILQYRKHGSLAYYSVIGPESLASASRNGVNGWNHNIYWTETYANYLSHNYFGMQAFRNGWDSFYWNYQQNPIQNISPENLLRLKLPYYK